MTVVHFADLENMLDELVEGPPIRVVRLVTPIETIADTPGMAQVQIGVHVRQDIPGLQLFAWMMPVGDVYTIYDNKPVGDPEQDKAEGAWQAADEILAMVVSRLKTHNENFVIRPGIIDLGNIVSFVGYWSLLETVEEEEEPESKDPGSTGEGEEETDEDELPF